MAHDEERTKTNKEVGGYILVGCVVIGMGISFALGNMPVGLFIGIGVGFLGMAIFRYKKG